MSWCERGGQPRSTLDYRYMTSPPQPTGRHLLRLADSLASDVKKLQQENEALKEKARAYDANDQMLREKVADLTERVRSMESECSFVFNVASTSCTRPGPYSTI